eukprot:10615039-Alexandrium_andersonii.AAC.1
MGAVLAERGHAKVCDRARLPSDFRVVDDVDEGDRSDGASLPSNSCHRRLWRGESCLQCGTQYFY